MIELLGQSVLNSAVTVGKNEFLSIFRSGFMTSLGQPTSRYARQYTSTRGLIIDKRYVDGNPSPDLTLGYQFQFNPNTIQDVKETLYETRKYAGLPYNDYVWAGGGERVISFQLFLDNTPQSKQRHFRPTMYGSKLAKEFKTEGTGYTYDENSGKYTLDRRYFGQSIVEEAGSVARTIESNLRDTFVPSKGPASFEFIDNDAYSLSRVDERGILPEVEKLQSFLYPALLTGETTPLFAEGGVVNTNQFRPPTTAILTIGPLYLEGVVKSAPVTYNLFDRDLTPIRGTVNIEFAVFEFADIERQISWEAYV